MGTGLRVILARHRNGPGFPFYQENTTNVTRKKQARRQPIPPGSRRNPDSRLEPTLLFSRLDALSSQREQAAALFTRWVERLASGAWNPDIAELVAHAEDLERTLAKGELKA